MIIIYKGESNETKTEDKPKAEKHYASVTKLVL